MEYILEIDNVFSKEFCEDVISRFEGDERKVIGSTVGGVDEKVKKVWICQFPHQTSEGIGKMLLIKLGIV